MKKNITPTYCRWLAMRNRCHNPNVKDYARYGGRGIRVCERWNSFENFLADMGNRPPKMTLDRINNDGDYCPENCRWTDVITQANNRRNNRRFEHNGENLTLGQWARRAGLHRNTLDGRLGWGWPFALALQTPANKRGPYSQLRSRLHLRSVRSC